MSPWSRFVYGVFHHEPIDEKWDLFGLDGKPLRGDRHHEFANAAIPELLFRKNRATTLRLLEPCRLVHAQKFGFLLYPLTGGFGYRSYLPSTGFGTLQKLEDQIMRPFAGWLTGMRMIVVLEKPAWTGRRRGGHMLAKPASRIEVWGTGSASREFLFVEDCARAVVLATIRFCQRAAYL